MATDPNIIASFMSRWQTPQVVVSDPLERYQKIQALKNGIVQQQIQQQQLQTGALNLQQLSQNVAGQKALNDAIQQNMTAGPNGVPVVNHNGVAAALGAAGHANMIGPYMEAVATQQKNQADAQKLQLENTASMIDQASRYFREAKTQDDWNAAIAHARGLGADPAQLGIPSVYSDQAKQTVLDMALSQKDQLAATSAALEAKTKQDAETRQQRKQDIDESDAADQALAGATAANFPALRDAAIAARAKVGKPVSALPAQFTPEGLAAWRQGLLSPDEYTKAAQAALNARNEQADREVANRIAQGHLSVAQAAESRQNKEFQAKFGTPQSRAMFTNSVINDPDSYFSLSPEMKIAVATDLVAQGKNVPVQLPSDLKTRAVSADLGLASIARIRQLMQDPDLKNATGPVWGRLGNAEQAIGDTYFGQGTAQASKEQELRQNFATLKMLEAKGLLGGRPAQKLIGDLTSVMASPNKAPALIDGALNGMQGNLANVKQEARNYAFGGASNTGVIAPGAPPPAAPAPHVNAAAAAKVGSVIPVPGGYVKKTGANSFIPTDAQGNPLTIPAR